jgi:CubicO group peptidase (beta-lactamase class C family)
MTFKSCLALCAGLLIFGGDVRAEDVVPNDPLAWAKPEAVGMSSERLDRIKPILLADIEKGLTPGAVLAIARHGKLVLFEAYGWRDKQANVAMTKDTIFNIASMTKPMTTVGALMLYEQGRLLMDEPLAKYFPQFAKQAVAARDAQGAPTLETVPVQRAITLQDLMRHTSGIIYGGRGTTVVHKLYPGGSADAAKMTGDDFIEKLASLPLLHQPGNVWDYGFGLDITGLLIEQQTHMTLGAFLQQTLFEPLGMNDTGFFIPPEKADRYAKPLPKDPLTGEAQKIAPVLTNKLGFECGGGCAASTAGDYLRFAMMLMNHGRAGKTQILSLKTVDFMLSNQLKPDVVNLIANADPTHADYGFGLGLAVRTTPGIVHMLGSVGQISWPGASGTDWWVDPKEELAVVYMSAAPGPIRWYYRQKINALVYQAIIE